MKQIVKSHLEPTGLDEKRPLAIEIERASGIAIGFRRFVVASAGLALGTVSSLALALGLGEMSSQSYLGQPLKAKVELININSDVNKDNLLIRLVNGNEAQAMGAETYLGPHRLDLKVVGSGNDLYVEIATLEPIKEPYLSVLLELRWPSGVVYREYPILLDPPSLIRAPTQQPSAADETVTGTSNEPVAPTQTEAPKLRLKALDTKEGKYKVQPGDNLSKISARWAEGSDQGVAETNQWIFENNPKAFISNDMNRLIAGAVLTMPDLSALKTSAESETDEAAAPAAPAAVASSENADQAASAPTGAGGDAITQEDVRGLMTVSNNTDDKTRELIDMLTRENENLRLRMQKLESSEYLTTVRELVLLQQQQIQELKAQLGEGQAQELDSTVETMFETIGLEKPVVVGSPSAEQPTKDEELTRQELLRELNNNPNSVDAGAVNENAIVELEPQGVEAIVDDSNEKRTRLITILFIFCGILAAIFSAMVFYYRKMIADSSAGKPSAGEDLPPIDSDALMASPVITVTPKVVDEVKTKVRSNKVAEPVQESAIEYDIHLNQHSDLDGEKLDPWYGEKVSLEEHDKNLEQAFDELHDEFSNLELDDDFLNAAREDIDEASLEAITQELPKGNSSAEDKTESVKVRRSDEEVRTSIAEKMAQYSEGEREEVLSALELDELDHFDDEKYDEVETVIYRAMMYCEFKKFEKARNLIEIKLETGHDPRLQEALDQIDALQVELEKKNAS